MVYKNIICVLFLFSAFSCVTEKQNGNLSSLLYSNSYPIRVDIRKVRYFSNLNINYQNVKMSFSQGRMIPVECDEGITGLVICAKGNIMHYNNSELSKRSYPVEDYVLFRFHPDHYAGIIANQDIIKAPGSLKEDAVWAILEKHFNFAFSNGMEAVIPESGSYGIINDEFSIVFDVKESGNTVLLLNQ